MLMYLVQAGVLLVSISAQAEARAFGNYYPYVAAPVGATSYTGTGYNLFNPYPSQYPVQYPVRSQYPTNTGFRTTGVAPAPAPVPAPLPGLGGLTGEAMNFGSTEGLSKLMTFLTTSMKELPAKLANASPAEKQQMRQDTEAVNAVIATYCQRMVVKAEQDGNIHTIEATKKTCNSINQIGNQILEGNYQPSITGALF